MLFEKGLFTYAEKIQPMSVCAVRAGRPEQKRVTFGKYSVWQSQGTPHDLFGC